MSNAVTKNAYYFMHDGKEFGPYSETEIVTFLQQGNLKPHSVVRNQDQSSWSTLDKVLPNIFPEQHAHAAPGNPFGNAHTHAPMSVQSPGPLQSVPAEVDTWSWAAFLWGPIWAISHKVWWGLLAFLPYVGLVATICLGLFGRKQAWAAGAWTDVAHMQASEKRWAKTWFMLWSVLLVGGLLFAIGLAMLAH